MAFNWFKKSKNGADTDGEKTNTSEQAKDVEAHHDQSALDQQDPASSPTEEPLSDDDSMVQESTDSHNKSQTQNGAEAQAPELPATTLNTQPPAQQEQQSGYFQRLKQGLSKTRSGFADLFMGKKALDDELLEELEMQLLTADVGIEVTEDIIAKVTDRIKRNELEDINAVQKAMQTHMQALLEPYAQPMALNHKPFVILMTGINGAGKTTTIGKLAHLYKAQGKKVMLAAGDTFRAAAVEQLQTWGERNEVPVIAQATGSDSASVAYDALQSAMARDIDVLIIDTAGRLHTQNHLMEELKKIKRVVKKLDDSAPHETMLVIDAGNGQNALRQAQEFHQTMAIDGITITKLDGTAKGGILFAITNALQLPIRFIGVGEKSTDLRPFNAQDFVNALLYSE